jgi:hypothetical protein
MLATKEGAARLAIVAVSLLIAIKAAASIVTGSIAIRAIPLSGLPADPPIRAIPTATARRRISPAWSSPP